MSAERDNLIPTAYQIRIRGHLDGKWSEWLYDLTITHESDGTTTLSGPLPDQTVLHSVLARIRDLNLPLISVCSADGIPVEAQEQDPSQTTDESPAGANRGATAD